MTGPHRTTGTVDAGAPTTSGGGVARRPDATIGFQLRPAALTAAAGALAEQSARLTSGTGALRDGPPSAGALGGLPESEALHTALGTALTGTADRVRTGAQWLDRLSSGLTGSAANYRTGDSDTARAFRSLLGGTDSTTGDTPTGGSAPFAQQIAANRDKVTDALGTERTHLDQLLAEQQAHRDRSLLGRIFDGDAHLDDQISSSRQRIELYQSIVDNNRKILDFDPSGDGRIVELIGNVDAGTRNVGVLVPGTFANLDNYSGLYERARSFVDADPTGGLAMVTWQDGQFPPSLPHAAQASYADALSPRLADFSHQLRDQISHSAAAGNDVQVTVAGHSYGGAVVGEAEHGGLDADRILHIESAGMGHDVWQPGDLHDAQPDVQRYSMTAPGDPIHYIRGIELGGLGHGADPDTFPGTVDLATGNYPDGRQLHGTSAHSDVFTYHSDAWWNMYQVFTGGRVTPLH